MRAAEDIPNNYAFEVEGVNFVNPVTFEDTGRKALFAAIGDYKAGEEITLYTPLAIASGVGQNVTRAITKTDEARLAKWGRIHG